MPLVATAVLLLSSLFGLRLHDVPKDLQPLQGRWLVTSLNGIAVDPADAAVVRIAGNLYGHGRRGTLTERGRFRIDAAKAPMPIDFTIATGPHQGQTQVGIVEVKADIITLHLNQPGQTERPPDFTPRDGYTLLVAKRATS